MFACVRFREWGRGDVGPVTSKVLGHSPPPPFPSPPPPLRRNVADADDVTSFLTLSHFQLLCGDKEGRGRERLDLLDPSSLYDNNIRVSRPTKSVTAALCATSPSNETACTLKSVRTTNNEGALS